ncbi:MAG: CIA30 family protein [Planctomycetota bacterium]
MAFSTFFFALLFAAMPGANRSLLVTDFSETDANAGWRNVNDNVMGGRSDGQHRFEDDTMVLFGDINTNGGGFTSVRLPIDQGNLAGMTHVTLRIKPDDRGPWRFIAYDADNRRINYRIDLEPTGELSEWQEVTIAMADMIPSWRGRSLSVERYGRVEPSRIYQIGLILNDTRDGPYELRVDRIVATAVDKS